MAKQNEQMRKMGLSPRKQMAEGLKKSAKVGYSSMKSGNAKYKKVTNPASGGNVKYHKY